MGSAWVQDENELAQFVALQFQANSARDPTAPDVTVILENDLTPPTIVGMIECEESFKTTRTYCFVLYETCVE
eukprot:110503-Amphidinium_carterae.2